MGRPLYSIQLQPETFVHPVDSSNVAPPIEAYEKWNSRNPTFDPDSDEFFESDNAVYEAFIDTADVLHDRTDESVSDVAAEDVSRASPMAVGSDHQANLIEAAYAHMLNWEQRHANARDNGVGETVSRSPPLMRREGLTAIMDQPRARRHRHHRSTPSLEHSSLLSRTMPITPIPVSPPSPSLPGFDPVNRPSTPPSVPFIPTPASLDSPGYRSVTPPGPRSPLHDQLLHSGSQSNLVTPSPAPSATPRLYHWVSSTSSSPASQRVPFLQYPTSPTTTSSARMRYTTHATSGSVSSGVSGPLSNPDARVSLPHLSHILPRRNAVA